MAGIKISGQQTWLGHPHQFPSMNCLPLSLHLLPDLFDNYMQQDAHEFLNYLLNTVADILQEEKKQEKQNGRLKNNGTAITTETETENKTEPTWVHDIFQGTLTNETRCLNCETVCGSAFFFCPLSSVRGAVYFMLLSVHGSDSPCVTLRKRSLLNKSGKGIRLLQRCWEMQKKKRLSEHARWASATHFTSGLLEALSSQFWGRAVGRVALNNPCQHQGAALCIDKSHSV